MEEPLMGETRKTSGLSRRTVLIAATGSAPLLVLTGGEAQAKLAPTAVKYQTKRRPPVRRLRPVCRPQFLQARRRRHLANRLVPSVGEEAELTSGAGRTKAIF